MTPKRQRHLKTARRLCSVFVRSTITAIVFFDDGKIESSRYIKGKLHTVRPIALEKYPVFCENCREITYLETASFGLAAQIEVGAMLVGKRANSVKSGSFRRGEEKGMFLYGGSTVVVLLRENAAELDEEFFTSTEEGFEISRCSGAAYRILKKNRNGVILYFFCTCQVNID